MKFIFSSKWAAFACLDASTDCSRLSLWLLNLFDFGVAEAEGRIYRMSILGEGEERPVFFRVIMIMHYIAAYPF